MIELTDADRSNWDRVLVNPAHVVSARPDEGSGGTDLLLSHPTGGRVIATEPYEQVRALLAAGGSPVTAAVDHRVQLEGGEDASGNVYGGYLTLRIIDTGIVIIHETDEGEVTAALGKEWDELRAELRTSTAPRRPEMNVLGLAPRGAICVSEVPDPFHEARWAYDNPNGEGRLFCCDSHVPEGWVRPPGVITWTLPDEHHVPITGIIDDLPGGWYWRFKGGNPGEYDEYLGPFDTHIQAAVYRDGPADPGPFDSIVCHEPPPRPGDPPYQASTVM